MAASAASSAVAADEPMPVNSGASAAPASASPSSNPSAPAANASDAVVADASGDTLSAYELKPLSYASKDVLQLSQQRANAALTRAQSLRATLARDPGAVEEPRTLSEIARLIDNPETSRLALEATAALPAPQAADLLYEVWAGTAERTEATELARALLYSKDVRPKASGALSVALDLRTAVSCEENLALLPRAQKDGDRRALHLLIKLQRRYGCGPNKRLDCYTCLRDGTVLDDAIKAVRDRKEPKTFAKR